MPDKSLPEKQPAQSGNSEAQESHKHNPFEEKADHLTKEEEQGIEEFKEAQTERD